MEYYTSLPQNSSEDGAHLNIVAVNQPYNGYNYTSARIDSAQSFQYGTIEVSAMLPSGNGVWPAIWMLPTNWVYGNGSWPDNGEIDIMEQVGFDLSNIYFHTHDHWTGGGGQGAGINIPTDTTAFHVYRLDWAPDHVAGFVDGVQYYYQGRGGNDWRSWPFDQPFHLIMNDAIGGNWGGLQGVDNSIFPQTFSIDSVRVWKMSSVPYAGWANEPTLPGRIEAENFDTDGEEFGYHSPHTSNPNPAVTYRSENVGIEPCTDPTDPGYDVGWMATDEWLNYTANIAATGAYGLTFRVATPNAGTGFNLEIDDNKIATITIPSTGGWQNWQSVQVGGIALTAGSHRFRILSNADQWNINNFSVWNTNATGSVKISSSLMRWIPSSKQMQQIVTVKNTSTAALTGPLVLAFDKLPSIASVIGAAGTITVSAPTGSPYVAVPLPGNQLAPGQSASVAVTFSEPVHARITYTPRVLTGPAPY